MCTTAPSAYQANDWTCPAGSWGGFTGPFGTYCAPYISIAWPNAGSGQGILYVCTDVAGQCSATPPGGSTAYGTLDGLPLANMTMTNCAGWIVNSTLAPPAPNGVVNGSSLYHNFSVPTALGISPYNCSAASYNTTEATALNSTYPFNTGDSLQCKVRPSPRHDAKHPTPPTPPRNAERPRPFRCAQAWKLAATVCSVPPAPAYLISNSAAPPYRLGDNSQALDWFCPAGSWGGAAADPNFGAACGPNVTAAWPNLGSADGRFYACTDSRGQCYATPPGSRPTASPLDGTPTGNMTTSNCQGWNVNSTMPLPPTPAVLRGTPLYHGFAPPFYMGIGPYNCSVGSYNTTMALPALSGSGATASFPFSSGDSALCQARSHPSVCALTARRLTRRVRTRRRGS